MRKSCLDKIITQFDKSDLVGLRISAHTLKSTSTHFGAIKLSDLCQVVETMADKGEKEGLKENIFFIEEEYKKVRLELQKISENGLS